MDFSIMFAVLNGITLSIVTTGESSVEKSKIESPLTVYNESIRTILKEIEEERREIFTTGFWDSSIEWTSFNRLMSSAYFLSVEGMKKLQKGNNDITEFELLNLGLKSMDNRYQNRDLRVRAIGDSLSIAFEEHELYQNNDGDSMVRESLSLTYLPIWGLIFNENYNEIKVLMKFKDACTKFNPVEVTKEYSKTFSVRAGVHLNYNAKLNVVPELIRLHHRSVDDRLHFYMMGVFYVECFALSQKAILDTREPLSLTSAVESLSASLSLLRRKYLNAAKLIKSHSEL